MKRFILMESLFWYVIAFKAWDELAFQHLNIVCILSDFDLREMTVDNMNPEDGTIFLGGRASTSAGLSTASSPAKSCCNGTSKFLSLHRLWRATHSKTICFSGLIRLSLCSTWNLRFSWPVPLSTRDLGGLCPLQRKWMIIICTKIFYIRIRNPTKSLSTVKIMENLNGIEYKLRIIRFLLPSA